MAGEQGISVRRPGGTVMVAADRVYFSFGDGRLSYGCVTCGAKCCRGFGYSVASGAEAAAHLKTRPAMRLFLEPVDANGLRHSITNCAPSCFFLTEQNLCGLQVDKGMEAKPETCRLFPFNNIWLINGYLVVSPHSSLCPLTVTPPPQRSAHSRHHALVEDMRFRGVASDATDADPSHTVRVAKLIALERTILAASERLLDTDQFDRFVAAQIEATRQAGLHDPAAWLPYGDAAGADVAARHATQVTALLGLAPAAATIQAPEVLRAVIATTPSIRARMLFGTNARAVSNGTVWQLPFVSTGLHLIVGLAREAGLKQITYLTVMDLFHSYRALLALLAGASSSMVLKRDVAAPWPLRASAAEERCYGRVLRGLIANESEDRSLGEILLENLPEAEPEVRLAFLKRVAERLRGHLQAKLTRVTPNWRHVRYAVQRATFARMSDSVVMAAALKLSAKPPARTESLTGR